MSITKQLNSKSNIKQYSNADYPLNPKQPVLNRYSVDSTASQTVINLPFSIDTVNASDTLLLSVDGKLLTLGSSNDYTFTSIDAYGFSSQITLTQSITAGLNIQAIKLGFKKETESARTVFPVSSNVTLTANTFALVNTSSARTLSLPTPTNNALITVKDSTGQAGTNNITINTISGLIDGAASTSISTNYGFNSFISDGTNWFKV